MKRFSQKLIENKALGMSYRFSLGNLKSSVLMNTAQVLQFSVFQAAEDYRDDSGAVNGSDAQWLDQKL